MSDPRTTFRAFAERALAFASAPPRVGGIRTWLVLLVGAAVFPGGALILHLGSEVGRARTAEVNVELARVAHLVSERLATRLEIARGALQAFAALPAVREHRGVECDAIARDMFFRDTRYGTIGAATPDGRVFCRSSPPGPRVNASDRLYFRRAMRSSHAEVGEFVIARTTGRPSLHVSHPIIDGNGAHVGVVYAAIEITQLAALVRGAAEHAGWTVSVTDGRGTILAQDPDPGFHPGSPLDANVVAASREPREGLAEIADDRGVSGLYAFVHVPLAGVPTDITVSVGVPRATALAHLERASSRTLRWYVVIAVVSLLAAWTAGELVLIRRFRRLASAAGRLGRGDLRARTGLMRGRSSRRRRRGREPASGSPRCGGS